MLNKEIKVKTADLSVKNWDVSPKDDLVGGGGRRHQSECDRDLGRLMGNHDTSFEPNSDASKKTTSLD